MENGVSRLGQNRVKGSGVRVCGLPPVPTVSGSNMRFSHEWIIPSPGLRLKSLAILGFNLQDFRVEDLSVGFQWARGCLGGRRLDLGVAV